ncbi:MAG: diacylglycerol kinase family lipid kinase [Firmicutes bacterium]|nr:diacylglycerol kinase family lipid kinase [Bacillota bacterium]
MASGILFVFNPCSGKGTLKSRLFEIVDMLSKNGFMVMVCPTAQRGDGRKIVAKHGKRFRTLLISGGDGTLNECISGLLEIPKERRPVVGYIPSGSTNDFASSLKIPKKLMLAVEMVIKGKLSSIDMGMLNKLCFVYIAAFGAFTDVAYGTPQNVKNYLGHMAYILEGIKRLPNLKSCTLRVEHDGCVMEGEFIFGMITNSYFVGGLKAYKSHDVDLADGKFECVFIKAPQTPMQLQSIITGLLMMDFSSEEFYVFKSGKLSVKSREAIDWTVDGEYGGRYNSVEIRNVNKAYKIIAKSNFNF